MRKFGTLMASRRVALDMMGGCAMALMGLSVLSGPVLGAQQAGVAAGVIGNLRVSEGERPAPEAVKSGMDMLLGDRVNSAAASRMQVLLMDETVFTIGPDSDLVIDEFVYDPSSQAGRLTANFTKGVLRYVSGKVAATNPTAVTIRSRDATIGVRGTALFIMDDPESADGAQFIGLLGPGGRNDGGLKVGGMTVTTPQGGTDVFRAGYGTFVTPGQAPGPVIQTPPRLTLLLQSQLTAPVPTTGAPAEGEGEGEGESDSGGGASESGPAVVDAAATSGSSAAETGMDSRAVAGVLADLGVAAESTTLASDGGVIGGDSQQEANMAPPAPTAPPPTTTAPPPPPPPPTGATQIENVTQVAQNDALGALPFGVALPFAIEMIWSNIADVDLHVSVNDPNSSGGRTDINYANTGSFTSAPFALLDEDQTGLGGSEVVGISALTAGAPYRAGVYNFGAGTAGVGTTGLANDANIRMRYITNGQISRGPGGSTIVNGTVRATVSPTVGQPGNVWVGLEIDAATGTPRILNRFGNTDSTSGIAAILDAP